MQHSKKKGHIFVDKCIECSQQGALRALSAYTYRKKANPLEWNILPPGKPHYQCKWPAWYKQSRLGLSLSQCSSWCAQILGYIMALQSCSLSSISHYLIVIILHIFQKHLFCITKRFVWYNLSIGYLRCNPFLSLFNIWGCMFSADAFLIW